MGVVAPEAFFGRQGVGLGREDVPGGDLPPADLPGSSPADPWGERPQRGRSGGAAGRRPAGSRSGDGLERRLDQLVTAGRQLVDGVAGTRPGGRGGRGGIDGVGRWVGERLDWLLDEGDDWREPWQERSEPAVAAARPPAEGRRQAGEGRSDGGGRRALEAISRRGRAPADGDWETF